MQPVGSHTLGFRGCRHPAKGWDLMTDAVPQAVAAALDDPFAELSGPLAGTRNLHCEVVSTERLSSHMQRIELRAPELDGFRYAPGRRAMGPFASLDCSQSCARLRVGPAQNIERTDDHY